MPSPEERSKGNHYNGPVPSMLCCIHTDMLLTKAEFKAGEVPAIYKASKPFEFKPTMAMFSP